MLRRAGSPLSSIKFGYPKLPSSEGVWELLGQFIDKNTDRTREGLCLISQPTPVPCARDSVTQVCTDSRARKPLKLRNKFATLSRAWVVIVLHFNHARRGRALAAISGKVPSVSGVWGNYYMGTYVVVEQSNFEQNPGHWRFVNHKHYYYCHYLSVVFANMTKIYWKEDTSI